LPGSLALRGGWWFSRQPPSLLTGEAECPSHGNLVAGPGKLSGTALPVLGEHQIGFSTNQECRKLLSWARHHGLSPPGERIKPWAEITF